MHHIYHTDAIILGSNNFGETGKFYALFTRELGMISASAQGIRKMPSKLRYVLQDFSYVRVDLVRGKDTWRITSASKTNALEKINRTELGVQTIAHISKLLKRLLQGEEQNEILFTELLDGLAVLEHKLSDEIVSTEEIQNTEMILVVKILYHLGYLGNEGKMNDVVTSPFVEALLPYAALHRKALLVEINKALHETQM